MNVNLSLYPIIIMSPHVNNFFNQVFAAFASVHKCTLLFTPTADRFADSFEHAGLASCLSNFATLQASLCLGHDTRSL